VCQGCGGTFVRYKNKLNRAYRYKQKFCTITCANKSRSYVSPTFVCERCGKVTARTKRADSNGLTNRQRFCSKKCANARDRNVVSEGFVHARAGYRYFSNKCKWVAEHRLVMERVLGVPLPKGSTVHHRDGNKLNNDPSNLELWLKNHGAGHRASDDAAFCKNTSNQILGALSLGG
jgi:hypothetical protein